MELSNPGSEPVMLPRDLSEFAIELRFDPAEVWLWAVVDVEGLTLSSGSSRSQTAAWRTATRAAESILQSREASGLHLE